MSSDSSLNDNNDITVERSESDVYLLHDECASDDDDPLGDDFSEDADKPEPLEPPRDKRRLCPSRSVVVVVTAAVFGVLIVAGVIIVVILSIISMQNSPHVSKPVADDAVIKTTTMPSSTSIQPSIPVSVSLQLSSNCSTTVIGVVEQGMRTFKRIPYAKAPLGNLRWRKTVPLSYDENDAVCPERIDAHAYGSKCVQRDDTGAVTGSEDCLFLNVWTPADVNDTTPLLHVMVHFHDGDLMTGSGHEPNNIPSAGLINQLNVVVVSFNYRLNVFGFLALDVLSMTDFRGTSGNYGWMDQQEALRWVHRHIASFGGDPNRVSVFGSGSGATSISTMLTSHDSYGLFTRAWLSNTSPKPQPRRREAEQQNLDFFNATGCADNETLSVQQADCLRNLSSESLMCVFPWRSWSNEHFYTLPSPDETNTIVSVVDGFFLEESPLTSWRKGTFLDIPLLVSSASEASDVRLIPPSLVDWSSVEYVDFISQRLLPYTTDNDVTVDDVLRMYNISSSTAEQCVSRLVSDLRGTCALDELMRVVASVSTSPVYRFQVYFNASNSKRSRSGRNYAYRGIDIDAFFDSSSSGGRSWLELSQNIRSVVRQFIDSGTVADWLPFPETSYDISTTISNATVPRFLSEQCTYWREHGFFPQYAWVN